MEEEEVINEKKIEQLEELDSDLRKGYQNLLVKPRIAMYLRALGFKFQWSDEHDTFLIPIKMGIKTGGEAEEEQEYKHLILIQPKGLWVSMRLGLLAKNQIPPGKEEELWESLLKANAKYPEFSFSANEEGDIGYNQDIFTPALNFDVFMEELLSIPRAIEKFWTEILPEVKKEKLEEVSFLYT